MAKETSDGIGNSRGRLFAKILKTAGGLFIQSSYKKVTIREIAAAVDISQVTIYNLFGSKDGLFETIFSDLCNQLHEDYRQLCAQPLPFVEKLEKILELKLESTAQGITEFLVSNVQATEKTAEIFRTFINASKDALIEIIEAGKKEGVIDPTLANESIMLFMDCFMAGLTKDGRTLHMIYTNEGQQKELFRMFFNSMGYRAHGPSQ